MSPSAKRRGSDIKSLASYQYFHGPVGVCRLYVNDSRCKINVLRASVIDETSQPHQIRKKTRIDSCAEINCCMLAPTNAASPLFFTRLPCGVLVIVLFLAKNNLWPRVHSMLPANPLGTQTRLRSGPNNSPKRQVQLFDDIFYDWVYLVAQCIRSEHHRNIFLQ